MIKDIPNPDDFYNHGLNLLNVCWDNVISLLTDLDNARNFDSYVDRRQKKYFESAKPILLTSLSIAQQGIEICLKGKISEISPFLLLYGNPRDWPNVSKKKNLYFADFRTIDAQDLVKVFNTFSDKPLPNDFIKSFDKLRKKRNIIFHTVDKRTDVQIIDIFLDILNAFYYLFPNKNWIKVRREYLSNSPGVHLYENFVDSQILWEISILMDILKPEYFLKFVNFNKRQTKYLCPICLNSIEYDDVDLFTKTAVLKPNTSNSDNLYCFVCDSNIPVLRKNCLNKECDSNVISKEYKICLKCGEYYG